jgi:hypothetical protein
MTPETIRIVSQLRQEFYSLFAEAMEVPVKITNRNSYAGSLSMVSWIDSCQRLNYMCVFAHTAPDELMPERPLILQIVVNKGGDLVALARQKKSGQELNQNWYFELILLPEEILEFLPWLISLVESYNTSSTISLLHPPYPLDCKLPVELSLRSIKTQKASDKLGQRSRSDQKQCSNLRSTASLNWRS